MADQEPRDWLTKKEAAAHAGVSLSTIERRIKAKRLRAVKDGGVVRIHREWVDQMLLAAVVLLLLAIVGLWAVCAAGSAEACHILEALHLPRIRVNIVTVMLG